MPFFTSGQPSRMTVAAIAGSSRRYGAEPVARRRARSRRPASGPPGLGGAVDPGLLHRAGIHAFGRHGHGA
ncbi:hypothetical protein NKH77_35115 [Streptomyces sp. M19]